MVLVESSPTNLTVLSLQLIQEYAMNYSVLNPRDPDFDFMHAAHWQALIITLYITVILVGLIGNATVIFIVCRNKHMQNVTNILIGTLAASDVALSAFCMPVQLHYTITKRWIFGGAMCRVMFAAFAIPMVVSTWTILLIAVDRYRLIVCPLRERISKRTALLLVASMVFMALCVAVPVMCFAKQYIHRDPDLEIYHEQCIEKWPSPIARKVYSVFTFTFQFCLPLATTALLYLRILHKLKERTSTNRRNTERKERTNKILVSIVTLFVICWLPWNLFSLIAELDQRVVIGAHFSFTDLLLKFVALSSACANPFLYCWLNENFRKELDSIAIALHVYKRDSPRSRSRNQGRQRSPQRPVIRIEENGDFIPVEETGRTLTRSARDLLIKSGSYNNKLHVSASFLSVSATEAISSCGNSTMVIETSCIDMSEASTAI